MTKNTDDLYQGIEIIQCPTKSSPSEVVVRKGKWNGKFLPDVGLKKKKNKPLKSVKNLCDDKINN